MRLNGNGKTPRGGREGRMRLGDYILAVNMTLNGSMVVAYLYQGHWKQAGYWFAALQLNYWLMRMT
jgi:hypothetical protein